MSERCEIKKVSTIERVIKKINTEMTRPVGIVLFGVDCELKHDILGKLSFKLLDDEAKVVFGAPSAREMVESIRGHQFAIFAFTGEESGFHELRHECVKTLRNAGAKTVVGIYTKIDSLPSLSDSQLKLISATKEARRRAQECLKALKKNPPTADGLDYLITIEEEETTTT